MKNTYLHINSRDEFLRMNIQNIIFFEADGNYTNIILANQLKGVVGMNLAQMQKLLSANLTEATKWYRMAAEGGDAVAQIQMGMKYYSGSGVAQSYSQAATWFRKAAEQGNKTAQYNLGELYRVGQGVTQNNAEAAKWYRMAAAQGHMQAQSALNQLGY